MYFITDWMTASYDDDDGKLGVFISDPCKPVRIYLRGAYFGSGSLDTSCLLSHHEPRWHHFEVSEHASSFCAGPLTGNFAPPKGTKWGRLHISDQHFKGARKSTGYHVNPFQLAELGAPVQFSGAKALYWKPEFSTQSRVVKTSNNKKRKTKKAAPKKAASKRRR